MEEKSDVPAKHPEATKAIIMRMKMHSIKKPTLQMAFSKVPGHLYTIEKQEGE